MLLVHGFASSAEHNWRRPGWLDLLAEAAGRRSRSTCSATAGRRGPPPRPVTRRWRHTWPRPSAAASPSTPSASPRARRCCCGSPPTSPAGSAAWRCSASAPRALERSDPEPIVAALTGDPDPENVHGMVFRRLAEGLGNDPAALIAFLRRPHRPPSAAELARITGPVLVVLGDTGPGGPRSTAWSPRCPARGWSRCAAWIISPPRPTSGACRPCWTSWAAELASHAAGQPGRSATELSQASCGQLRGGQLDVRPVG